MIDNNKLKRLSKTLTPVGIAEELDELEKQDQKLAQDLTDLGNKLEAELTTIAEGQNLLNSTLEKQSSDITQLDRKKLSREQLEAIKDELKGDCGKDYILTEGDKREITKMIKVPVAERVIEKTETIIKEPIVTNEIKEVAVADTPFVIVEKLESLTGEERLDVSAIKGIEDYAETRRLARLPRGGGLQRGVADDLYAPINTVPRGIITMWYGSVATIPTGWVLCDGTNSTPDLRDQFIVGAKQDDSGTAKTNITGSLTQTGGTTEHSHDVPWSAALQSGTDITDAAGGGDFEATMTGLGQANTVSHLPSYYALAFIMKT